MKESDQYQNINSVKKWIIEAQDMFEYLIDLDENPLTNNTSSIRMMQGWIKHSFLWSVYFLLKADAMAQNNE